MNRLDLMEIEGLLIAAERRAATANDDSNIARTALYAVKSALNTIGHILKAVEAEEEEEKRYEEWKRKHEEAIEIEMHEAQM